MLEITPPDDPPIACTLAPGQYADRMEQLAALAVRSRERLADGERLTFVDTPDTERQLRAVIAAESSCCPFLTMQLGRDRHGLVLEITGPQGTRPIIAELFSTPRVRG
jgi:hypothetical protein